MANFIIKKDGTKEPFDTQKIKNAVVAAATDAGLSIEEGFKIAEDVSGTIARSILNLNEVVGAEIRARILSQLDATTPKVAEAWRKYDKENNK
ncbi:MAG: ATP cone domain-containing protein [Candidatus Parcubacteria bacterium]|nr:ATP cone domain-containing protein [Candidatus Parcubacteria bacterium]